MEQQGPGPRHAGGQDHRVGPDGLAGCKPDRPAAFAALGGHRAGADHAGGPQARRAGLQIAQPFLQIVSEDPAWSEGFAVPASRPLAV